MCIRDRIGEGAGDSGGFSGCEREREREREREGARVARVVPRAKTGWSFSFTAHARLARPARCLEILSAAAGDGRIMSAAGPRVFVCFGSFPDGCDAGAEGHRNRHQHLFVDVARTCIATTLLGREPLFVLLSPEFLKTANELLTLKSAIAQSEMRGGSLTLGS